MGGVDRRPRRWWRPIPSATCCCSSSRIRRIRDPFPDHRPGDLGGHRRRRSTCWCPASAPAGPSPAFRATSSCERKKIDSVGGRGAGGAAGDHADAGGQAAETGAAQIQGIGAGFIPDTLDLRWWTAWNWSTNEEAIEMARRLAKEEGILCGISCGAAVAAAVRLAQEPEMKGKTIVVILPDSGERYLSTTLLDDLD